ncbi:MAG: SUMF1/EgtB/PvdO family nonheme iron enzyme [candidate division KSB1 bacterium]|nr:SUMF1/EgtB/PvdO family nonheme iron enzyme [candidate division KSB1 bacterium]MDZ7304945.1 SUMF1/EgtB/PvdO family nonheme iron enzyme [candidate division KSB1 bacterium]MDZ7311662.1 SUMF1/EgtB/PvdO family nonheme iron enzyme [candidate division KSB1 bacterium]
MNGDKTYKKLRIFVAAPGDVTKEREAVHAVAAELNRESNVADQLGVTLKVLDWREVTPNMGRPQQVILDELKVETWDIFIGILWLRFGSPTGGIDPQTGRAYDSGTEEEFNLAYDSWKKNGRPRILFYRCTRPPVDLAQLDPDQYKRVKTFFEQFEANRAHQGLVLSFATTDDFERRVRFDLTKLLFEYGEKVLQKKQPPPPPDLPGDDLTQHYLNFVRNEHGKIKLFGFLSRANIDVRLLDVFVSLHFSDPWREMEKKRLPVPEERENRALTPPQVLQRAMQKKKSLLILGGPGSGKTTLLKYFAVCCLDADSRIQLQRPLIPIFVPLRQIDPAKPFTEALAEWAKAHNQNITAKNFAARLHQPGALVLLDGLDEVSALKTRRQICEWIDKAAPAYGESTFLVTCRFTGYREAEGVALQTPHTRADVLDLNTEQQRTFLQQWFRAAGLESLEAVELNDPARLQEIEHDAAAHAQAIMEFLGKKENRSLAEMAGIPVLLQIMAIIWRERGSLSGERVELYNSSIDYLLEHRDRTKKIEPLPSAAKAKFVLQPLALWMQKQGQDETSREKVEAQIAAKLQEVRPGTSPGEFLENIRDRAGVLVGSGAETYTFQHKSFREFLAAIEIANQNAAEILVKNFGNDWWRETVLFSAGLTSPAIFPAFLEHYLKHEKNDGPTSPLYLQMLQEAAVKPLAPFEKVLRDKRLSWQKRYNALKGVRLLRSEAAKELVKFVHGDKEPRLRQLAEAILIEWSEKPPAVLTKTPDRFFNPIEGNAEYILIRGGTYQFSTTKKKVTVPDMYFAKFPVTNKRYRIFLESLSNREREKYQRRQTEKRFLGDDQPVVAITWYSAMAYCEWLTEQQKANSKKQKESLVFRLPTEIEWAATGGKRIYPWEGDKLDETRANYGNKIGHTTPVGSYPAGATPEGLMDMAGNAWEWCLNGWDKPDFVLGEDRDLLKNWRKVGTYNWRALRGGAYYTTDLNDLRGSGRVDYYPVNRVLDVGFRVCVVGESRSNQTGEFSRPMLRVHGLRDGRLNMTRLRP